MNQVVDQYEPLLVKSTLFSGMEREALLEALKLFKAVLSTYRKGDQLCGAGDTLRRFGFLLQGVVQVCDLDMDGNTVIMASVTEGITFGESIAYLGKKEQPLYIYAAENASVLWLDPACLYAEDGETIHADLRRRFTSMLAERTLHMNSRIQILSKISIREKLMTFFSQTVRSSSSRTFSISMNRNELAAYIGTNRSALSRELSMMKKEGIIDYYRNTFRVIQHDSP